MARKKKDRIMAFEILSPDTLHPHTDRVCRNFICYENSVRKCLEEEIRNGREHLRNDPVTKKEFDTIVGYQTELRDGLGNLGLDLISLLPIEQDKSIKPSSPYIYRILDYSQSKPNGIFCGKKEAVDYLRKKVKTKNVLQHYDGKSEKCEFNPEYVQSILGTLEADTIDFDIQPIGRGNEEGDMILLTIFKNRLVS